MRFFIIILICWLKSGIAFSQPKVSNDNSTVTFSENQARYTLSVYYKYQKCNKLYELQKIEIQNLRNKIFDLEVKDTIKDDVISKYEKETDLHIDKILDQEEQHKKDRIIIGSLQIGLTISIAYSVYLLIR